MKRNTKKPQLRVCSVCHKPGHNKSRCPEFLKLSAHESPVSGPYVKMYLHEDKPMVRSPHLINLKIASDQWDEVETVAPEIYPNDYYYNRNGSANEPQIQESSAVPAPVLKIQTYPLVDSLKSDRIKINRANYLTAVFSHLQAWRDNRAASKALAKMEYKMRHNELARAADIQAPNIQPVKIKEECAKKIINPDSARDLKKNVIRLAWRTAVIALALVTPFQANSYYQLIKTTTGQIASDGTEGFMALQESTAAIMQSDLAGAENLVADALKKFNRAVETMNTEHKLLQTIASAVPIVSDEVQSRQKIISAGQKIALGNTYLINGLTDSQTESYSSLTERIAVITSHLKATIPNYQAALNDLSAVNPDILPIEYQNSFKDFRLLFAAFLDDLQNLAELGGTIDEILGGQGFRRYLLVFQNPHEMRPTGGFLGSFALMDIKDGKVTNLEVPAGGSYDLQGQLDQYVEPPTPLLLSNNRWEFQDANWFPDFPASAEKILWFYRHSRQITADGVIAVNATVLEQLLAVLGPVTDEKRELELSADNALMTIQQIVETGPEKMINKPKQIISDLAPQFINFIYNAKPEQIMPLLVSFSEALKSKEIQAYFVDKETEQTIRSYGWSGQILPTLPDQDYLLVVNTNIQGQKSDAEIKQSISHQAVVGDDGIITDTVVVTREHTGMPGEALYGQTNIDYIRVYVPLGSELVSAGGFTWPDEKSFRAPEPWTQKDEFLLATEKEVKYDESSGTRVTEEFGKTAFGNWIILEPGETRQIQFTYRLPFKIIMDNPTTEQSIVKKIVGEDYLSSSYMLVVQRQSGQNSGFESQIIYPTPWHPSWNEGETVGLAVNGASFGPLPLTDDKIWSIVMRKDQ